MNQDYVEYPELSGKTIQKLRIYTALDAVGIQTLDVRQRQTHRPDNVKRAPSATA
jgi:hypothetical protein